MSSPRIWLSIEPRGDQTRLLLSTTLGPALKATLPPWPVDPRALSLLLDGLAAWYGEPLCAVVDVDAQDVQQNPARWAHLLGDLGPHIDVEWVAPVPRARRRTMEGFGDFRRAHRLLSRVRDPR